MPEVNAGISTAIGHGEFSFFKRRELGLSLRAKRYSHAIVIPRSWKSALIPYFANIPVRSGYTGEMRYGLINDLRVLDKSVLEQTVQRYVAHAGKNKPVIPPEIPNPSLQVNKENQTKLMAKFGLKSAKPVLCLMPGAEYGPAKQWPIKYYKNLAVSFVEIGWQVWIIGSEKDTDAGDEIAGIEDIHNLCGKTQLVDTVDILACARAVVCNDSGLMHIAASTGVNVNVIYGSSTPDYTPPLTSDDKKNIFYLGLNCSPCFKRVCPLGHTDCLNKINDESVFKRISQ
jgi:heptosyltransferase-2